MKSFKTIFRLLVLSCSMLYSIPAQALDCDFRQRFFSEKNRGSIAFIKQANSLSQARSYYANWCSVSDGAKITDKKGRYFFAINNRYSFGNEPFFAVLKVYRRGPSTKIRPLLTFRRVGSWEDHTSCGFDKFSERGPGRWPKAAEFVSNPVMMAANARYGSGECDLFNSWDGQAFGSANLRLSKFSSFLRNVPENVALSDARQWSLSLTAYAYASVLPQNRSSKFPVILVSRDDATDLFVEYFDNSGVYRSFSIEVD